jgi:Holliday junction resolvase-like predicted endonuclease
MWQKYAYWLCAGWAMFLLRETTCRFDGATLAVVEVRTRQAVKARPGQPELSITKEKHGVLLRATHYFLRERRIPDSPVRFDGVVIERHTRRSSQCAVAQSGPQSAISTAFPMKTNRLLVTRFP